MSNEKIHLGQEVQLPVEPGGKAGGFVGKVVGMAVDAATSLVAKNGVRMMAVKKDGEEIPHIQDVDDDRLLVETKNGVIEKAKVG